MMNSPHNHPLWHNLEELESLTQASAQLQFITEIIRRSKISASVQSQMEQGMERIRQRLNDPNLYLAVIGEFSSGKSTFINALLRDDLLKRSDLVTTAAATRLMYGADLKVAVRFKNHPGYLVRASHETQKISVIKEFPNGQREISNGGMSGALWRSQLSTQRFFSFKRQPFCLTLEHLEQQPLPWLSGVGNVDIKQFIHTVTADPAIAQHVTEISITHPAPFLADRIVIIDTPGTNATVEGHTDITRAVVESEADAAIIVTPISQPLSKSLKEFLGEFLQPYLHRCIFVVTRMDSERRVTEHNRVLNDVEYRLNRDLGVVSPTVYGCAAQAVIDQLTGEEEGTADATIWQERFLELEKIILHRLRQERALNIAENTLRLLTRLFDQLNSHLRDQRQTYQKRQTEIQQQIIPDLRSFTAAQHTSCRQQLSKATATTLAEMLDCIHAHRDKTVLIIYNTVMAADSKDALKKIVEHEAQRLLREDQKLLSSDLQKKSLQILQAATSASQYFDQKFSEVYSRLQVLNGRVEVRHNSKGQVQLQASQALSSAQLVNQNIDSLAGNITFAGYGLGAAIGTIILPGIGTIIGAGLGALLGLFFVTSLDEHKQKLWQELQPNLVACYDTAEQQARQSLHTFEQQATQAIDQRIDAYIKQYQAVVEKMQADQRAELQRLTQLEATTQADLAEIERRRQSILAQTQRLAQIVK